MSHPRTILSKLNIRPRKSLSQNFLTSPHWAETLTDKVLERPAYEIWEIGPGLGALTFSLVNKTNLPIHVFEYDKTLAPYLKEKLPSIKVTQCDFLKMDIAELSPSVDKISLIANLPYHISSPLLFQLLPHRHRFVCLVLTFQKELTRRLIASPRTHSYSALSVLIQLHFQINSLGVLPPGAFYPKPEVESEAVVLYPLIRSDSNPILDEVVRAAFAHRRKKLLNNLRHHFPQISRERGERILVDLEFGPLVRAEELSVEDFVRLADRLLTVTNRSTS